MKIDIVYEVNGIEVSKEEFEKATYSSPTFWGEIYFLLYDYYYRVMYKLEKLGRSLR
jgi:hypothetical protein